MKNALSLLEGLMGGSGKAGGLMDKLGGQSAGMGGQLGGLAGQAKDLWARQSGTTKAVAGGGLLAVLLGGKGKSGMVGGAVKMGGAAVVGALAYRAWQDWQTGKAITQDPAPQALPSPEGTAFLPSTHEAQDDLATRLVQVMVAAAKADGHVTPEERTKIDAQLAQLGLDAEAERLITTELDTPLDVGRIAALARTPEEGAEVYAASLLVVNPDGAAEKGYLAMLAARLGLDPELVKHLHARVADLA